MIKRHKNKLIFLVGLLVTGILYCCATTKDNKPSLGSKSLEISEQSPKQTVLKPVATDQEKVVLSNAEVFALFKELKDKYKDDKSNSNYIYDLNDFEDRYGPDWNARGLISIERGETYYRQYLENPEYNPSSNAKILEKSKSEFQAGLNYIAASKFEDKEGAYLKKNQRICNLYCQIRFLYLFEKIESVKAHNHQKRQFLEKYRDIFNDSSCPNNLRAWAVRESILHNTYQRAFKNRVNEAYQYIGNSNNTEEIIYITFYLARAEFMFGSLNKSLALYNQLDEKTIIANSKDIYGLEEAEGLIAKIKQVSKILEKALENTKCLEYWNTVSSSKRYEKILVEIVESYNELQNLCLKGRKETTPVYEKLSYSVEKIIVEYNVSPLLFKVQSAAERLAGKIKKSETDNYSVFFENMLESVSFLQKSVDYRIKGYYTKKKDYRGEWEKADAYMDESRGLFSVALQSLIDNVDKIFGREYSRCIIDIWKNHIKNISDMKM